MTRSHTVKAHGRVRTIEKKRLIIANTGWVTCRPSRSHSGIHVEEAVLRWSVPLVKVFNFSEPQLPHPQNGQKWADARCIISQGFPEKLTQQDIYIYICNCAYKYYRYIL